MDVIVQYRLQALAAERQKPSSTEFVDHGAVRSAEGLRELPPPTSRPDAQPVLPAGPSHRSGRGSLPTARRFKPDRRRRTATRRSASPGSAGAPVAALVALRPRSRRGSRAGRSTALRCANRDGGSACARRPTGTRPTTPVDFARGTCGTDLHTVGQATGSLLRLLQDHPSPTPSRERRGFSPPPPPRGGARKVRAGGSVL